MARRAYITTELGQEAQCSKCKQFWPADKEFYFFQSNGRPHSWCKACYTEELVRKGRRSGYGNKHSHNDHARKSV